MKIAIHHRKGSFSERWISYCEKNAIDYKVVNAFDSDIIQQVKGCNAFMWHHHHGNFKDVIAAKKILFSLEQAGIKVFPDFNTGWHFDDKVAQKYLLEAIDAPLVPSYVFYDKKEAMTWARQATYPKVFKLKSGASSSNVIKVNSYKECKSLIKKAFSKGFNPYPRTYQIKSALEKFDYNKLFISSKAIIYGANRLAFGKKLDAKPSYEKSYVYFQDFVPNAKFDIRVIVIKDIAFAIKRQVRKRDFRASGSGKIIYNHLEIPLSCIKIAFDLNDKLSMTSLAIDFVMKDKEPLVIEISYGFNARAYDFCEGYWNKNLNWINDKIEPEKFIIESLL